MTLLGLQNRHFGAFLFVRRSNEQALSPDACGVCEDIVLLQQQTNQDPTGGNGFDSAVASQPNPSWIIMKNRLEHLCKSLLLGIFILASGQAMADVVSVVQDGIKYEIDLSSNTATLTDGAAASGEFSVPATVNNSGATVPVVKIGDNAFLDNTSVTKISLPTSVTEIGRKAFGKTYSILGYDLNEGLISIADSAFWGTAALNGGNRICLKFPSTLKKIGYAAFHECYNINEFVFNEGLEEICDSAFYQGDHVTAIKLPSTLKVIGNYAFSYNYQCTEINFGGCSAVIGDNAFSRCSALTTISGDENLKKWGNRVFADCTALTDYSIPAGLEEMGYAVFLGSGITDYKVAEGSQHFCVEDGNLFTKDMTGLIVYDKRHTATEYVVPSTVKKIYGYAFYDEGDLTSIVLPDGLEEVGPWSMGLTSISAIHFPAKVKSVGDAFHYKASSLASITVDENNPYMCAIDNLLMDKNQTQVIAYPVLAPATELILPETVLKVHNNAVNRCQNLLTIVIDDACTEIDDQAFDNCTNCTSLIIGKNVRTIGYQSFRSFMSLTSLTLPEELRVIKRQGFTYLTKLTDLKFNKKLQFIGWAAFMNCTALEEVTLPASLDLDPDNGLGATGSHMPFLYCSNLKRVIFEDGGKRAVSPMMFYTCPIEYVKLPEGLEVIGFNAFQGCSTLTSITLPESLKSLREGVFNGTSITSIHIPDAVEDIAKGAFQYCPNLETVTGGKGIKKLGEGQFIGCPNLKNVPDLAVLEKLPNQTFYNCTSLSEDTYTIPEGTKTIGQATFANTGFINFKLAESVETIEDNAFQGTITMETFTAGENLKTLGAKAFINCSNLREVNLNEGLETIGYNVFGGGQTLEKFIIPSTVDSIGTQTETGYLSVMFKGQSIALTEIHDLAAIPQPLYTDLFENETFYSTVQLFVPAGSEELYKAAPFWKKFVNINTEFSGIDQMNSESEATIEAIYTLDGRKVCELQPGVNIVRMSDGTSRKVIK